MWVDDMWALHNMLWCLPAVHSEQQSDLHHRSRLNLLKKELPHYHPQGEHVHVSENLNWFIWTRRFLFKVGESRRERKTAHTLWWSLLSAQAWLILNESEPTRLPTDFLLEFVCEREERNKRYSICKTCEPNIYHFGTFFVVPLVFIILALYVSACERVY